MRAKVSKAIGDFSMIQKGDKVVVALSGGADSVALLDALNSMKELLDITLYVCHLNHNIRGDEAKRDEDFVVSLCEKLGVELFLRSLNVCDIAQERKESLELCGRFCRYEFFGELSESLGAKIATAHTSSDNVETVLYNEARGTSLNGLCGIKPKRDCIIRPLIYCSREDVERYCDEQSLSYVVDSTNLTDDYTRNNIRHNVVPVLKSINPDLENTVQRMCATLGDVKDYLDKISSKELSGARTDYGYSCEKLLSLDKAVLSNCIFLVAKESSVDVSFRHIELIIEAMKNGGCVDLSAQKRCVCKQGVLRIVDVDTSLSENVDEIPKTPFLESGFAEFVSKEELKNINKKLLTNCINCDIISVDTVIRTRKDGDTFTLSNRNVTKSLKKLFNELKIPAEKRNSVKLVANGNTVLWIEGVGVSKQGRVDKHSFGAYRVKSGG
ncbi:MAG: tRNA lysidine(34) synthetase TilS [Ruminococcus sp.]|nr:tRNA lysidine(34) synthetase TilS [Ruminococcus sp.]